MNDAVDSLLFNEFQIFVFFYIGIQIFFTPRRNIPKWLKIL